MADLEQQYAPSSVAGGSSAPWEAQYRRRSAAARDAVGERLVELDGGSVLVEAGAADAPLMVFIHGGYWQALSAAESLFPADDLLRLGWAYAALEYPLAPNSSIETMIGECASTLARLAGSRRRRVVLVGHSAGAHLAAMLALAQRPPLQIDTLVLISGIYDLRPLVGTSINHALRLDLDGAASLSPLLLPGQSHPDVLVAWGEIETEAFVEQSQAFAAHLQSRGSGVRELCCPGRNHFDILFDLGEPTSELGRAIHDPGRRDDVSMGTVIIERIAGALGAEISGLDLTSSLSEPDLTELRTAVVEHKVVFLRDQPYETEHLVRLTEQLGGHGDTPFLESMPEHPGVVRVVKERDEGGFNFGGAWHSDWSFQPSPPALTLLWSIDVPPHGGDTLWSNQELAYDTLSSGLQATLDSLDVVHSAGMAYSADGFLARTATGRSMQINTSDEALAEQLHPAVTTHPESGRRALFVNSTYSVRFDGWTAAESAPLLQFLYTHATREAFTCRFRWTPNTLAIWDNRSTQHNALNDYRGFRRELHRTTVAGSIPRR